MLFRASFAFSRLRMPTAKPATSSMTRKPMTKIRRVLMPRLLNMIALEVAWIGAPLGHAGDAMAGRDSALHS
jgi:hypothetical protein